MILDFFALLLEIVKVKKKWGGGVKPTISFTIILSSFVLLCLLWQDLPQLLPEPVFFFLSSSNHQ